MVAKVEHQTTNSQPQRLIKTLHERMPLQALVRRKWLEQNQKNGVKQGAAHYLKTQINQAIGQKLNRFVEFKIKNAPQNHHRAQTAQRQQSQHAVEAKTFDSLPRHHKFDKGSQQISERQNAAKVSEYLGLAV